MSLSYLTGDDERPVTKPRLYSEDILLKYQDSLISIPKNEMIPEYKTPIFSRFNSIVEVQIPLYMRLERLQLCKWHYYAIFALGGGLFIDGFEIAIIAATAEELKRVFNVVESQIGLVGSFYMLGGSVGSLLFGYYSQSHGRKKLFYITLIIYIISILISICSSTISILYLARLISGIAIGGEYTAIYSMIDEIVPSTCRGRVNILVSSLFHLGSMFAGLLGLAFQNRINEQYDLHTWRVLLLLGIIIVFPILYIRNYLPESPRWIFGQSKPTEAELIVDLITYCCEHDVIIPLEEYKRLKQKPITLNNYPSYSVKYKFSIFLLIFKQEIVARSPPKNILDLLKYMINNYRKRFALCFAMLFASNFVYKGIFYTHVMMIKKINQQSQIEDSQFLLPLVFASFLGPIIIARFFDLEGRKKMIGIIFLSSGVLLFINGILFQYNLITAKMQLFLWFLIIFFTSPGLSACHLTISEVFPISIRSQALGIFNAIGLCIGGAISPYFFGVLIRLDNVESYSLGYFCSSFVMITAGVAGMSLGINAENIPLEQI